MRVLIIVLIVYVVLAISGCLDRGLAVRKADKEESRENNIPDVRSVGGHSHHTGFDLDGLQRRDSTAEPVGERQRQAVAGENPVAVGTDDASR
jgi:hypothetical protein